MARTIVNIPFSNAAMANQVICNILTAHNYKNIVEKGENVWKCGVGFLTAMKYIKVEFVAPNYLALQGWIRPVLGSEQDLNGVIAAIPKKQVMKVIQEIQATVR